MAREKILLEIADKGKSTKAACALSSRHPRLSAGEVGRWRTGQSRAQGARANNKEGLFKHEAIEEQ